MRTLRPYERRVCGRRPKATTGRGPYNWPTSRPVLPLVLAASLPIFLALVPTVEPAADSSMMARVVNDSAQVLAPYVPTPEDVVDRMLRLAGTTKNDVVYDLGCGDGRIPIAAAKTFGARGVGIDIDPKRIEESKANAKADSRASSRMRTEGSSERTMRGRLVTGPVKGAAF